MANTVKDRIDTRKVAFLVADGFDDGTLSAMKKALITAGALAKVVAPRLGTLTGAKGTQVPIDFSLLTAGSVLFDALYIPGGQASVEILKGDAKALVFVQEAFLHCKAIAASDAGVQLLLAAHPGQDRRSESHAEAVMQDPTALLKADSGIIVGRGAKMGSLTEQFVKAIAQHRHWDRELKGQVPA